MFLLYLIIGMGIVYMFAKNGLISSDLAFIGALVVLSISPFIYLIDAYNVNVKHRKNKYEMKGEGPYDE